MTDQIVDMLEAVQRPQVARLQADNEGLRHELRSLLTAFRHHRTATHRIEPKQCMTCLASDEAMAYAERALNAEA